MRMPSVFFLLLLFIGCDFNDQIRSKSPIQHHEVTFETLMGNLIEKDVFISDSLSKVLNKLLSKQETYIYFADDTVTLEDQGLGIRISPASNVNLKESQYHLNTYEICIRGRDSIIIDGLPSKLYLNKKLFANFLTSDSTRWLNQMNSANSNASLLPIAHIGVDFDPYRGLSLGEWEVFFQSIHQIIEVYKNNEFESHLQPLRILLNFEMDYCSKFLLPKDLKDRDITNNHKY